jgi:hypothetical protein
MVIRLVVLLVTMVTSATCFGQGAKPTYREINKAYKVYLSQALGTSPKALISMLTIADHQAVISEEEEAALYDIFDNLSPLEKRLLAGDRQSLRLAFALFNISNGHFSESLDIIIGQTIKKYPLLFTQELHRAQLDMLMLPGILGNCGDELTDDFPAQCKELKARYDALHGVRSKKHRELLQACLAQLKESSDRICQAF